jgi:uncharacterized protein YjbI with pentapeptide repeats
MVEDEQYGPKEAEWEMPEEEKFLLESTDATSRVLEERLRAIAVTSVRTKNLFLFYLGICVFALLTAATITDFQLLSGSAKIPLPIIKVEVRPLTLFVAGPFLVLGSYFYFLMYLSHLRRMIRNLKLAHPDTEEWRLYPWVFNMRNWFARIVAFGAEYPLPGAVVAALWYRSLVLHNVTLSSVLGALMLLGFSHFSILLFQLSHKVVHKRAPQVAGWFSILLFFIAAGLVGWYMPILMEERTAADALDKSRANYRGWFFRPADMALISHEKAGFIDTYLVGANLTGANLPGTKFLGANMRKARLLAANLAGADFSRVPGKRPTDLSKADLTDANLRGANLREAILKETVLRGSNMRGADLRWANLAGVNLQEAKLGGAQFQGANLEGADLRGAVLEGAVMTGADLRKASLDRAILKGADLRWTDLSQAVLRRADLKGANFKESVLIGTDLEGALNIDRNRFEGALMDDDTIQPDGSRGPVLSVSPKREGAKK